MKIANVQSDASIAPVASSASTPSAVVDVSSDAGHAGALQSGSFNSASGFEAEQRQRHTFEEARRNHLQLSGLMAKVRKPMPRMTQRMARAGLRAGGTGSMRGEYAYRNIFHPVDGRHYEMMVHPVKNLLEWNFSNVYADPAMQAYLYGSQGLANKRALLYGQPWQTPSTQQAGIPGTHPSMQPGSGFQFAAQQFSPFRQGQFQYPPLEHAMHMHHAPQRNPFRAIRRRPAVSVDHAAEEDTPFMEPHPMSSRRNAEQWRDVVSESQSAGMTAAEIREWINDFHDCRRYPCVENHAKFNEKYGGLFDGDIGDEKLRPAFDALRRAFGAALAPGHADSSLSPNAHALHS